MTGANSRGFEFDGDQQLLYLRHDKSDRFAYATALSAATLTLGSEVEKKSAQGTEGYRFDGPLSLVYAPEKDDSPWTIASGVSAMTGSITINKGILSIEGSASFANVPTVEVKENAKFSCVSTASLPLKSLKNVKLASSSTFEIGEGIELSLDVFLIDGEAPRTFGWFTGSDNENPQEGDQQSLSQLKGTGRLYIPFQGSASEVVWSAGAGDADTYVTTAANWEGEQVPDFSNWLDATFATSGEIATFTTSAFFKSIYFSAQNGFTLYGEGEDIGVTLSDGVSVAANAAQYVVTNKLAVPVQLNAEQMWMTPANTVLELRSPISSESNTKFVFGGAGTYAIYSTNTFTGTI